MRLTRSEAKSANRQALLDAARLLVFQDGPAVPVEAIAEAADLTTGAIYSIFGSKNDLLVAMFAEDIARIDSFLAGAADPALSLRESIERYVDAWFASYTDDTLAQTQFELQVMLAATSDPRLGRKLTAALDAEVDRLTDLFAGRRVDGTRPKRFTTDAEARLVASAVKAAMTGFALRQTVSPQPKELVRASCVAIVSMLRENGAK